MGLRGMPGIDGGLGCCCFCGKPFTVSILMDLSGISSPIQTVRLNIFEDDMCIHDECREQLQTVMDSGRAWRDSLGDFPKGGPLRIAFEKEMQAEQQE